MMKWTRGIVIGVAVAAAAAILLGFWASWSVEAQTVRWVNDADGQPVGVTECDTAPYNTIAGALTAAAADDIIRLCEGTYDGATIGKRVTVEGRAEADRDEVVVQGASDGFVVDEDDVTIRHLTLEGAGTDKGIWVEVGKDDVTISDVEVTNWLHGIAMESSDDFVVQDSDIHGNAAIGIAVAKSTGTHIIGNTMTSNGTHGLSLHDQDETIVQGNTISGNTDGQIGISGVMHVRILGNVIDTGSDGIEIAALGAEAFVQIGGSPENANTFTGGLGGGEYYISLDCGAENTVDATHNWWGTVVEAAIRTFIFNDEYEYGTECPAPDDGAVVFHPWATSAAPTPTPSPTATPSPTPTPTATPTPTRDFDLPAGWNDFVWTGASDTAPATALGCIVGDYVIAYRFMEASQTFQRYVPDRCDELGLCNMTNVDKYDSLLVLVAPAATQCLGMPVIP